jgi:hypothetical protein
VRPCPARDAPPRDPGFPDASMTGALPQKADAARQPPDNNEPKKGEDRK